MYPNPNLIPVMGHDGNPLAQKTYIDTANNLLLVDQGDGNLVKMDLGPGDVHVQQALTNFALGYSQAGFAADIVSPTVPVPKQSDKYYIFDPANEFAAPDATLVAAGGNPPEVNPKFSTTPYSTNPYALAAFLPLEVIGNQDAVLNLAFRAARLVLKKLLLLRELRVQKAAFTTANFPDAGHLTQLTALQKWNGGSNSDPVRNIRAIIEACLAPITGMVMSRDTWHAFTENPAVQKYVAFKSAAAPLPQKTDMDQWAALLDMPKPIVCDARSMTSAGAFPYIWSGSVFLFHQEQGIPVDGYSTASMKTFRWIGGDDEAKKYDANGVPGMSAPAGFTIRALFNPYRGPRGGWYIVASHNDADVLLTDLVSGLITGAFQ